MSPKKKIKLEETLDNVYEDDFKNRIYDTITLTQNEVKVIEIVNYQWKVFYKIEREQNTKKLSVSVEFDSRYVFKDKIVMNISVEAGEKEIKKQGELEKVKQQQYELDLAQFGDDIDDNDIKVTFEIGVYCAEYNAKQIGTEAYFNSEERPHDVVLIIGDEKFYVLKQYLATWSKYFNTLFFGESAEKNNKEFQIEDVKAIEFTEMLHFIYPSLLVTINDYNVLYLLKLADRFEMPSVFAVCGTYLCNFENLSSLSLIERLELADKHGISHLQVQVLKNVYSMSPVDHKKFFDENRDRIKALSEGTINNLI